MHGNLININKNTTSLHATAFVNIRHFIGLIDIFSFSEAPS